MPLKLNNIYNMDCLEGMKQIADESIDCIICDLPYGVLNKGNPHTQWDSIIPFDKLWEQYLRIAKPNAAIILFGSGIFTAQLMMSQPKLWRYNLIWKKGERTTGFLNANRMPLRNHEDIAVFYRKLPTYNPQMEKGFPSHKRGHGGGQQNRFYGKFDNTKSSDVYTDDKFPKSVVNIEKEHDGNWLHPTQKPVALLAYLIRTYTNMGGVVLDNCMGSGTTAIACIREKRHFIGFEINKEYFDKAQQRISSERQQLTLF